MTPDPKIAFAVAEIIGHGRGIISHIDRLTFFAGVLRLADEAPELEPVRLIVARMEDCDAQLSLIEREQRQLALSEEAGK